MSCQDHPPMNPANRPPVVLLHASGSSARQWLELTEMLQPRFRVCAVEFRGHGVTGDSPFALDDEVARVAPLVAKAGGAHFVGHSYGAAVAMKLAAMHPGSVRSLIAYEPVLVRWLMDDEAGRRLARDIAAIADRIRNRLSWGQDRLAAQLFVEFWSGAGAWDSLPGATQIASAAGMRMVLRQFDAMFREALPPAQLARLAIPMLFMNGAKTIPFALQVAGLLREELPHARHEALPGMGHMGPITHAQEVNRTIAQFLDAQALLASREDSKLVA
jgi:pimeloyl-ACP methyl ester carboxylesterase